MAMARIVALFAVFALATAAPSFSNFTAQYVCENKIGTRANSDGKHCLAGDWNLTTCDSACKDAMVWYHTGLGCCSYNNATNGCCWSEVSTPVPPYTPSDQKFASIIDAGKWQAKKASDYYEKKDYDAASSVYEFAIASFVANLGKDHLLTQGLKQRHSMVKVLNNESARLDLDANYPYTSNTNYTIKQLDRCSDGVQNGNETGVDCGGSCSGCPVNCIFSKTPCSCTASCGSTCSCNENITITTPAAYGGLACPSALAEIVTGPPCLSKAPSSVDLAANHLTFYDDQGLHSVSGGTVNGLIDGLTTSNNWGACPHTKDGQINPWVAIDLEASQAVCGFKIRAAAGYTTTWGGNAVLAMSDTKYTSSSDFTAAMATSAVSQCTTVASSGWEAAYAWQDEPCASRLQGRYAYLRYTDSAYAGTGNQVAVCDIEVLGCL